MAETRTRLRHWCNCLHPSQRLQLLTVFPTLPSQEPGKQVNFYSVKLGLGSQVSVSNSLINRYTKHTCLEDVKSVLHSIREPTVVSWNALILGLATNGCYVSWTQPGGPEILISTQLHNGNDAIYIYTTEDEGRIATHQSRR